MSVSVFPPEMERRKPTPESFRKCSPRARAKFLASPSVELNGKSVQVGISNCWSCYAHLFPPRNHVSWLVGFLHSPKQHQDHIPPLCSSSLDLTEHAVQLLDIIVETSALATHGGGTPSSSSLSVLLHATSTSPNIDHAIASLLTAQATHPWKIDRSDLSQSAASTSTNFASIAAERKVTSDEGEEKSQHLCAEASCRHHVQRQQQCQRKWWSHRQRFIQTTNCSSTKYK